VSKITIIQRVLPHYRKPLFVSLHRQLAPTGIQFQLIYGQEYPGTVPRSDRLEYPWAIRLENRYFNTPIGRLVWQPCLRQLRDSDLIIVEQANSLLLSYCLMIRRKLTNCRLAFWGHGQNFQARSNHSLSGDLKKWLITQADWWFAYTDMSAQIVRESGFSPDKITVVQNAIDTEQLQTDINRVTDTDLASLRARLELPNDHIGLYCGGMYADKQLDFLIEASRLIRRKVSNFNLIVVGSGPEQGKIEMAAREHAWIHYVGQKLGRELAAYFKASQAILIPGAVGLAIVDSFVAETPLFTTNVFSHGPEIAYLRNGENGVMTVSSVNEYANSVAAFLESHETQQRLKRGCRQSAEIYTLDNMVFNFAKGIRSCLNTKLNAIGVLP
jgi:glycosyltransferase involved in cell wall biosynthesis